MMMPPGSFPGMTNLASAPTTTTEDDPAEDAHEHLLRRGYRKRRAGPPADGLLGSPPVTRRAAAGLALLCLAAPALCEGPAAPPEDRARPGRRRGARNGAHRRHPGARGAPHSDRLHRRHEHGLDRRRPLCVRLHAGRDGDADQDDPLGDALPGRARPAGAVVPAQGGRLRPPPSDRVRRRLEEGARPAARAHRRQQARFRAPERDICACPRSARSTSCASPSAPWRPTCRPATRSSSRRATWPDAIRASMAIPAIFSPVELDGRLLIDGGESQNLPVQTARAMGADIVIAVNVGESGQMPDDEALHGHRHDCAAHRPAAAAEHGGLGPARRPRDHAGPRRATPRRTSSRGDGDDPARTEGGRPPIGRSSRPGPPRKAPTRPGRAGTTRPARRFPIIDAVDIDPVPGIDPRRIDRGSFRRSPARPLDTDVLGQDLKRIYALGIFEIVSYAIVEEGGRHILRITATPKPWGPTYLRLGLALGTDFDVTTTFGVVGLLDATELNRLGGEWKTTFTLGSPLEIRTRFFQPLEYSGPPLRVAVRLLAAAAGRGLRRTTTRSAPTGWSRGDVRPRPGIRLRDLGRAARWGPPRVRQRPAPRRQPDLPGNRLGQWRRLASTWPSTSSTTSTFRGPGTSRTRSSWSSARALARRFPTTGSRPASWASRRIGRWSGLATI